MRFYITPIRRLPTGRDRSDGQFVPQYMSLPTIRPVSGVGPRTVNLALIARALV